MRCKRTLLVICLTFFICIMGTAEQASAKPTDNLSSLATVVQGSVTGTTLPSSESRGDFGNDTDQVDQEGGGSPWMPEWLNNLIGKIDDMLQTFKDLMSGKLIYDSIEGFIVKSVDEAIAPFFGVFSKSYLFTLQLANMSFVYKGWSFFAYIGLGLILVALGYLTYQVIRGKKDLSTLLKVFLGCFILGIASLTILNFVNVGINWLSQIMYEGMLGTSDIDYQALDGEQVLKAIVLGTDGITNPAYAGQTLGQIVVQTEGGMFTLISYVLFAVIPLFIVTVIKGLALIGMAILAPLWITYTAFTGKYETLAGFFNLYVRALLVGLICGLHWAGSVKLQSDYGQGMGFAADIGIHPIILSLLSVVILLVFLFFFWFKPLWYALKSPMTLSGSEVVEKLGERGVKLGETINNVGKRLGSENLQKKALNMKDASKRMSDAGKRMRSSKDVTLGKIKSSITGGVSESFEGITYKEPETWLELSGDVMTLEEPEIALEDFFISASGVHINEVLKDEGFTDAKLLNVKEEEKAKMNTLVQTMNDKYKKDVIWNEKSGQLLMTGVTTGMLRDFRQQGFDLSHVHDGLAKDGTFVDFKQKNALMLSTSEKAEKAMETVKSELPVLTRAILPQKVAQDVFSQLQKSDYSWAKEVRFEKGQLWIPEYEKEEVKEVIEGMLATENRQVRFNLPRHSKFSFDMIEDWKKQGETQLVNAIELSKDGTYLYIEESEREGFVKKYEEYRENRTPYWRAKNGKIFVIKDGVPVDHGQVPINGLNMGSFEQLQTDMMHKHQENKQ
ncbi:hypothetical protein [Paenibacillus woosongensis]|uniref:Uncharacterized protein n=1 Tax=Paenibacillus woosongensis TaxID=307580 RepID=A0ABQ4MZ17_9BACL|nr:hypothetical protein [Paenibacillus woosongensis]GIP61141.1 hypothetical protein J15TS10_49550 [Paenibacillus woosongensis]